MMEGYDPIKAEQFIFNKMQQQGRYAADESDRLHQLIAAAIEADQAFIASSGVLDGEYYDEDDAFEAIVDAVIEKLGVDEAAELDVAEAIEMYMEFNDEFLEENDLVDWE